jgi:hypothetical protein
MRTGYKRKEEALLPLKAWLLGTSKRQDNFIPQEMEAARLSVGNPVRIRSCSATVWGALPSYVSHKEMAG